MHPKPKPIRRTERKGQSIYRNPGKGFVLPRLNEPEEKTEAVGFIDWREYEYDGGTVLRNPTAQ